MVDSTTAAVLATLSGSTTTGSTTSGSTTSGSGITISMTATSSKGAPGCGSMTITSPAFCSTSNEATSAGTVVDGSIGSDSSAATATELTRADPAMAPAATANRTRRVSNVRMTNLLRSTGGLRVDDPRDSTRNDTSKSECQAAWPSAGGGDSPPTTTPLGMLRWNPAMSTSTLAAADVNTQMEPAGDNFAITSLATVPPAR